MATVDVSRWRVAVTLALGLLLAHGAGGAFDEVQWPLFVAVGVVGVVSLLVVQWRPVLRAVASLVSVVAATLGVVLAAGGDVGDAGDAVVRGPRQLLTTEWPSPAVPTLIGVLGAFVAVTTAVAADLAGRRRLHLAPLVPFAIGWAVVLGIGAPVRPPVWSVAAVGTVSLVLALMRFRTDTPARARHLMLVDRTVVVTVVGVIVATTATASAVAWADRADPRRTQDAQLNAPVLTSIEEMVALRHSDPEFTLYEITDRSRLVAQSLPARWRIAALDSYDGQRWSPRLTLRPIGGRLGIPSPVVPDRRPPLSYRLVFGTDDLDLLPFPGPPLSASVDVATDLDRVAVRTLQRPDVGTVVFVESEVGLTSRSDLGNVVAKRQVDELAAVFSDLARRLGGREDQVGELRQIEATMRDEWGFDDGAPGGGQQFALIERFLTDTQRGTEEQFVTGFVLLARSLGMDARVATGFIVPPAAIHSDLRIQSSMASVWPEVRMADGAWVAFDPVPDTESVADEDSDPQTEAQTPAAAQPPVEPPVEDSGEVDDDVADVESTTSRWATVRAALVRSGVALGIAVLPVAIAVGAVLGMKWARRRRRLRQEDPAERIRGAWANATDLLVDAGLGIVPSWTDERIAQRAVALAPSIPHEVRRLAAMSALMTFGTTSGASVLVDDALSTSSAVDVAIGDRMTRRERVRWRLSLRSLRRSTRSPVTAGDKPGRRRRRA